jgi:hypothetical protein
LAKRLSKRCITQGHKPRAATTRDSHPLSGFRQKSED